MTSRGDTQESSETLQETQISRRTGDWEGRLQVAVEGSLRLLRKGQEKNHDSQNAPLSWYENLGQCNAFMYK